MRTIVAFVLTAGCAQLTYAQPQFAPKPSEQIERLEKRVADGRSVVSERVTLVNLYFQQRNVEDRRRHLLWLIANHPEVTQLVSPPFALDRNAPLPDPIGFAKAAQLLRAVGAHSDANPKAIGNAIRFFRLADLPEAKSLLDAGLLAHPEDPDLLGWRGVLLAMSMGGEVMTEIGGFRADRALQLLPEAVQARKAIESSSGAMVIGSAAEELRDRSFVFTDAPALNGEDPLDLAEKWLLRVREMKPEDAHWKTALSIVYEREAAQTADPKWKVQLLRKADAVSPGHGLQQLALAEFEAGDDESAARDAHRLLDFPNPPPQEPNVGHAVLGRIALAHGDIAEAKAELLASLPATLPPYASFEPDRTLAQDLLDHGERDIVIQFFEQAREFWKNDRGAIDHYIKLVKAPGTHDLLAYYRAGQELRGRPAPKLPIDDYSGKVVAVQFRDAACKTCAEDFATANKIAGNPGITKTAIEKTGHEALVRQYEIDQFPTWVLIDRQGRIADYMPGRVNEQDFARRIDQLNSGTDLLPKLAAPSPVIETSSRASEGKLAWSPVSGAQSYVVQFDQRDEKGWQSDRDQHLVRVIPTDETSVRLDPALGETAAPAIRWRVAAVNIFGAGAMSDWREIPLSKP